MYASNATTDELTSQAKIEHAECCMIFYGHMHCYFALQLLEDGRVMNHKQNDMPFSAMILFGRTRAELYRFDLITA